MRKINNKAIIILSVITLYVLASLIFLVNLGNTFFKIINPLFWILLCILCHFFFKNEYVHKKYKKDILLTVIIGIFVFFILYYMSGILVGFQPTPYSKSLKGIILNIWSYSIILLFQEYIRQILINRTGKNKKLIVLITILFILVDVSKSIVLFDFQKNFMTFQYISSVIIPSIAKHMLLSYLTYTSNYLPSAIYAVIMETFSFIVPFIPNFNWFLDSIINLLLPFIIYVLINKMIEKNMDRKKYKKNYKRETIYIPILAMIVVLATLVSGVFKYQLVAVASDSMKPSFSRGDAVLIKKLEKGDIKKLKVGDIIIFSEERKIVIHRIIEVEETNSGANIYRTKGDNNNAPDSGVVEENNIIGKYIVGIKFIGYPSILLQEIIE